MSFVVVFLVAGWVASCSPILATAGAPTSGVESPYYDLIGIGWSADIADGPRFVWRQEWPGIEPSESIRVFKYLEGDDINDCLATIIDSSPELRSELAKMGAGTACGGSPEAIKGTRELWTSFGLAEALAEVARLGRRGDAVAQFLARCGALRDSGVKGAATRATP